MFVIGGINLQTKLGLSYMSMVVSTISINLFVILRNYAYQLISVCVMIRNNKENLWDQISNEKDKLYFSYLGTTCLDAFCQKVSPKNAFRLC